MLVTVTHSTLFLHELAGLLAIPAIFALPLFTKKGHNLMLCRMMSDAMTRTFSMPKWSSPIPAGTSATSHALTEAKNKWLALDRPDRLNDCSRVARCSASAAQPVIFLQHHIISYLHITYIILINLIYPLRYKKPEIIPWKSPMHEARTPEAVLQELPCIVPSVQL